MTSDIGLPLNIIFYFRGTTNADENLQALEDQLLEAGPEAGPEAGAHHSHADHHRDEQTASPEAQTRVSPPTFPVWHDIGCFSTGTVFCIPLFFSLVTSVLQSFVL